MNVKNIIGLGTAAIGRPLYINIKQKDSSSKFSRQQFTDQAVQVLDRAYERGIRYFDTAPGYGIAEEILMDWLLTKNDPSIEVATKWGYTYVANFDPTAVVHEIKEHSLTRLKEQWRTSKNLFPFLHTYQIHSATLETGVLNNQEVIAFLGEIKKQHDIQIGLTTTGASQVEVIKKALDVAYEGTPLFEVFQCTFNILDQTLLTVAPKLRKQGRKLIIKEAMANGRIFPSNRFPHYELLHKTLERMANQHNVGIDAIALQFCAASVSPDWVLSGASRVAHIDENLLANNVALGQEQLSELSKHGTSPEAYWKERSALPWN